LVDSFERYTVYFICKLLYMFRVVPPPIIMSTYNCIYSIWYLSHRYCCLYPSWGAHTTIYSIWYLSHRYCYLHPSSGAHTTVSTASGVCHTVTATSTHHQEHIQLSTASGICHTVTATSTHHQEHIQLYLQHLVFVTPLMLPPPIIRSTYNWIYSIWYLSHLYCYLHPSSGVHTTESTASGICHTVTATSTHHQEHIQLYLQHLVFVTPLLLPPPIIRSTYNCIYSIWYLSHLYCYLHPSSGVHTTVSTASGICHTVTATSTHHQEHIQLYLQHLVFVTPLLLPVAIMEDLRSVVDKMGISNQ